MNTSNLTPDQQEAFQALNDWLNSDEPTLSLTAYAGCGKTWLVAYWLKTLTERWKRTEPFVRHIIGPMANPSMKAIIVTAPTHKAVGVLRSKLKGIDNDMCMLQTTHAALCLRPVVVDTKTGRTEFKPERDYDRKPGCALMIVDEASMVGNSLYDYIRQEQLQGTKVLYVGDVGQIPPVGELVSPVFKQVKNRITLSTIVRQEAGNPIINLAHEVREHVGSIKGLARKYDMTSDVTSALSLIAPLYADHASDTKMVAWRNATVSRHNRAIRRLIYGGLEKRYMIGELLTFLNPYSPPASMEITHEGKKLTLSQVDSNTDCRVVAYHKIDMEVPEVWYLDETQASPSNIEGKFYVKVPSILLELEGMDGQKLHVVTYDRDNDEVYMSCKGSLLDEAKSLGQYSYWQDYYSFLSRFADIEYGYCITAHRSQGSTYQTVVVDDTDISANWDAAEKTKLYYTSVTRSAKTLIVV